MNEQFSLALNVHYSGIYLMNKKYSKNKVDLVASTRKEIIARDTMSVQPEAKPIYILFNEMVTNMVYVTTGNRYCLFIIS